MRDSSSFAGLTGDPSEARDGDRQGGKSPADTTYMSDRELKKALRIARRDARWAALDQRDADKAAAKAARKGGAPGPPGRTPRSPAEETGRDRCSQAAEIHRTLPKTERAP